MFAKIIMMNTFLLKPKSRRTKTLSARCRPEIKEKLDVVRKKYNVSLADIIEDAITRIN